MMFWLFVALVASTLLVGHGNPVAKTLNEIEERADAKGRSLHDSDQYLNVTQIIARWGYPVENYEFTTSDGYILQIQRIPHGRNGNASSNGKVAFLQHGLFSSSYDFVNNPPSESLGFIMADEGYDVFLGNVRGNVYGRRHTKLNPDKSDFWKFSFDEFIAIDVPEMIDFVLQKTGKTSLHYVGHSQGTLVMFALLSTKPEYQNKIAAYAALAPVANVTYIKSPIRYIAPFSNDLEWIADWLGIGEFGQQSLLETFLANILCKYAVSREICEAFLWVDVGIDTKQLNVTRFPVYLSHFPSGTSVQNLVHFGQLVNQKRFQKFDYGTTENQKRYGQPTPPEYDVRKIENTPTGLFWSENDYLADPDDVQVIADRQPSIVHNYKVPEKEFTHLDFLIGITANRLVYDNMLEFFSKY